MAKRIVVVDDEQDILRVIIFRLKKKGYEVFTAVNGKDGLALIKKQKPDLALLDLRLPEITGDEICKYLKTDQELFRIPVILISASSDTIVEAMNESGACDCMLKPFDPSVLIEKIEKWIL